MNKTYPFPSSLTNAILLCPLLIVEALNYLTAAVMICNKETQKLEQLQRIEYEETHPKNE